MLPAGCGRRYLCVITPNGGQGGTQVPWSALGRQQAQRWSLAALSRMSDRSPRIQGYMKDWWISEVLNCPDKSCILNGPIFIHAIDKMHRLVGTAFDVWCSLRFIFRIVICCVQVKNSLNVMLPQALSHGPNWCKVHNNFKIEAHYVIRFYYSVLVFIIEYLSLAKARQQTYSFWWGAIKYLMVIVKLWKCCFTDTHDVHILNIWNSAIMLLPVLTSGCCVLYIETVPATGASQRLHHFKF